MSLDLDAIRQRHLRKEQMAHRTFYEGHIVIDLAVLIEEVERLREENDRTEHARSSIGTALHLERLKERAATIVFLRAEACDAVPAAEAALLDAADAIDSGEHRREEEP